MARHNDAASAMLDRMLAEQAEENRVAASKPCSQAQAKKSAKFLKGWAKGKPITKWMPGDASTMWKCGKWMTKIEPSELAGLVKYGFAKRIGDTLTITV